MRDVGVNYISSGNDYDDIVCAAPFLYRPMTVHAAVDGKSAANFATKKIMTGIIVY